MKLIRCNEMSRLSLELALQKHPDEVGINILTLLRRLKFDDMHAYEGNRISPPLQNSDQQQTGSSLQGLQSNVKDYDDDNDVSEKNEDSNRKALADTLHKLTLRKMIEMRLNREDSSISFSDKKIIIESVKVDQIDAFDLLDIPLSLWLSPNVDPENFPEIEANIQGLQSSLDDDHEDKFVRGALYDKQDFSSFKKISYEKTDDIRSLIYDSIKPNVLFEHDTQEEILQIIDVFKPREYKKGEVVIKQGDEGSEFYVVESGELSIHVTVKGEDKGEGGESSQVKVGEYSKGSAFGELALIFGSPRAATITATSDCKLWSIERMAYRSVISQLRYEQHVEKNAFLRTCVVSDGRPFFEIFDASQIEDLTIATKVDFYEEGAVILREG